MRVAVETATMIKNSPMPVVGPVATKTTDNAAGRKIPKPLIPMTFLEKAIIKATSGNRRSKTIVFAGTPAETAPLTAYLMGFPGQTGPRDWDFKIDSNGPKTSSVF